MIDVKCYDELLKMAINYPILFCCVIENYYFNPKLNKKNIHSIEFMLLLVTE